MAAIDADELILAYRLGIFPMAENRDSPEVLWVRPRRRGILPLESFHVPRRLARTVRQDRYRVTADTAFDAVIRGCAENRRDTWINAPILAVFEALHVRGLAHSVECWDADRLVGGVYGLAMGGAFFAESKFNRATDASKVALVHLAARLKAGGFSLLDAQFPNPHLVQFGAIAVSERRFEALLAVALEQCGNFYGLGAAAPGVSSAGVPMSAGGGGLVCGASVLQVITQTS